MLRLVQGDVGSGKTVVAAMAALTAIAGGCQAAIMAPTELLAEQHALAFANWLEPLGYPVAWLAGKLKGKAREQTLAHVADGTAKMIVGTHAIFQDQVSFDHLALIIIDEQHRFGVHQRLELREKGLKEGNYPHQLIMTATPIPRTLAMTAYADLDTSIIDELPPGRTPVTTVAIGDNRRHEVVERVRQACKEQGRQAYWVCTLIDESEVLQCQAAEDTAVELGEQLSDLQVGLVHGRMKSAEKQQVMDRFKSGDLDLLVATPGRLMDYIEKEKVACRDVEILVIDEADRMLDMGFGPTVDRIAAEARWRKQTLLFSATLEGNAVEGFARDLLNEPARISTSPSRRERKKIAQYYYRADDATHKLALLKRLLADEECTKAVVFVRTRERVEKLIAQMDRAGIRTNCLKGEMPQAKRDAAIARFRDGEIKVLIATDVAARGLDIQGITHVINYDLPRHADTYVHRIGRTARAGAKGCAISIVEAHDHPYLGKIERYVGEPIRRRVFQDMKPQTKEPSTPKKAKKPASKAKKPKKPKKK